MPPTFRLMRAYGSKRLPCGVGGDSIGPLQVRENLPRAQKPMKKMIEGHGGGAGGLTLSVVNLSDFRSPTGTA